MAHTIEFRDYLFLVGDEVHVIGRKQLKMPIGIDLERPADFKAGMRYSSEHDYVEMGLANSMMILSDRPDTSTFVNRSGDSMFGNLRMINGADILNSSGAPNNPSYTFLYDQDTGIFSGGDDMMSLTVGSSKNQTAAITLHRFGSGAKDQNIFIEGDLWADEITFDQGLKLDGNYMWMTGTTGFKVAIGSVGQRPSNPLAVHRYNSTNRAFEFGFDYNLQNEAGVNTNWAQLSPLKDKSTWLVRSGDSMFGDLQMTNNADVRLTDGSPTNPSLTFDVVTDTGIYRSGANAMSLVARGGMNPTPAITIDRFGNGDSDQNIFIEGDLWADEITFDRGLKLDGNYMWMTGYNGFRVARGTTAQRTTSNISGTFRYNNTINAFEFGYDKNYNTEMDGYWGILSPEKGESTWLVRSGDSMTGDLQMINNSRVLLTSGTMTRPSLAFDASPDTGLFSKADNHIGISLDNNGASHPVIEAERYGTARQSNKIWLNGDIYADNYYATTEFKLTTPNARIVSTNGLVLPIGTNTQHSFERGKIRYNTTYEAFHLMTNDNNIYLSGEYGSDTYVRRIGDDMAGTLTMKNDARIQLTDGTSAVPALNFTNDSDTGLYRNGENEMVFVVGGALNPTGIMALHRYGAGAYDQTVYINGNLVVEGGVTNVQTTDMTVEDNVITLNKGGANSGISGIEIEGAGSIKGAFHYNLGSSKWSVNNSLLTDLPDPLVALDATNKRYVNAEDAALRAEYTAMIAAEKARAEGEEQRIEGRLNDEIVRATNEENRIDDKLDSEIGRATARENQIESNLNSEINRATNEEARIEDKLDSEIQRSTSQDATHSNAIASEIQRASNEETRIEGKLDTEITRSTTADNTLTNNLSDEIQRATNEEARIEGKLDTEITRSSGIDTNHSGRISTLENKVSTLENASQGIVQEFMFNTTINAGQTFTITKAQINNLVPFNAIVKTKVVDDQPTSPTYNYYVDAEAVFTIASNTAEILVINESSINVTAKIIVWIKA